MKPKMISGFQSTGRLTLGNYLGVIKPAVQLQEKFNLYIFVADLHALTLPIEPQVLRENRQSVLEAFYKAGINPKKCKVFFQSDVPQHTFLSYILTTQTNMGELKRMTQFKDKASQSLDNKSEFIPTGLLVYPVLMASDILLYNSEFVLVGKDQTQHLELTRNIATRFNNKYGETFVVPKPYIMEQSQKIMSLQEPEKKMSKSDKKTGATIFLDDDPDLAFKKVYKSVTDNEGKVYFSDSKPGISNLLNIYSALCDKSIEESEIEFQNKDYGYFKTVVAQMVKNFLIHFQQTKVNQQKNYELLIEELQKEAQETIEKVKEKIGLN